MLDIYIFINKSSDYRFYFIKNLIKSDKIFWVCLRNILKYLGRFIIIVLFLFMYVFTLPIKLIDKSYQYLKANC